MGVADVLGLRFYFSGVFSLVCMGSGVRMTTSKPDVQALIEKLASIRSTQVDSGWMIPEDLEIIAQAEDALSALSGETETEWEYGARIFISGKVERIADNVQEVVLLQSRRHGFGSEWVADSLVRRRKAGEWEVVV